MSIVAEIKEGGDAAVRKWALELDGVEPARAVADASELPHDAVLELYQVHAVTEGTDAQAEVSVRLCEGGRSVTARTQRGKAETERRIHSTDVG